MSEKRATYDVAISFLYRDLVLAQALFAELSKNLNVFFFPRNQEELAGTDGLESMREPFRNQSLLNVVLYRPEWGKTPWTGVEEVAVKESCLATSFRSVFFLVIEPTPDIPSWLPETHVRFNYADFSLEQAVGAIKARVQDRGGHFPPMTPTKKVEILRIEEKYEQDRRQLDSAEGRASILQSVQVLFKEIVAQADIVNANGHVTIQHRSALDARSTEQVCSLGLPRVGVRVVWLQPYIQSLDSASLMVRELGANPILLPNHMFLEEPPEIRRELFTPDISRARECVWKPKKTGELITSKDLAERIVLQLLDLLDRDRAGR